MYTYIYIICKTCQVSDSNAVGALEILAALVEESTTFTLVNFLERVLERVEALIQALNLEHFRRLAWQCFSKVSSFELLKRSIL